MADYTLEAALEKLQGEFADLDFTRGVTEETEDLTYTWPGAPDEDILVCVHKSRWQQEPFHRHEFFYFNYTYKGQYESMSYKYDHKITIRENELYAGQPYAGHALCMHDDAETVMIGVLVRREAFFHHFLPLLSVNSKLFRFFIDPTTNHYSEEFLHFRVEHNCAVRTLLEMMVFEYAWRGADTQSVLKPLVLAFLIQIARQYAIEEPEAGAETLCEQIVRYMSEHIDTVSLKDLADRFSYHPNYISTLMRRELGRTFSEILLEQRMERAVALLRGTTLSVEEISTMLG